MVRLRAFLLLACAHDVADDRSDEMLTARPRTMWLSSNWRTLSLSAAVGDGLMGALLLGARMVNSLSDGRKRDENK